MNKQEYNNVIETTIEQQTNNDSLTNTRAILGNMGLVLPNGDLQQVSDALSTDDYMGWRACSAEEAQECVDNGTAVIAVSDDQVSVLTADDNVSLATTSELTREGSSTGEQDIAYYANTAGASSGKEIVTISYIEEGNDQGQIKIVFGNERKTWFYIGVDTIFTDDPYNAKYTKFNYFVDGEGVLNNTPRTYELQELRLLYLIDPYGVANYVEQYAKRHYQSPTYNPNEENALLKQILEYKDLVFSAIFGRAPKYFEKNSYGNWVETTDKSDLLYVLSESEALFGKHAYGGNEDLRNLLSILPGLALERIKFKGYSVVNTWARIISFLVTIASVGIEFMQGKFDELLERGFEYALDKANVKWIVDIVNFTSDLFGINRILHEQDAFTPKIIEGCALTTAYHVRIERRNGNNDSLQAIASALNGDN